MRSIIIAALCAIIGLIGFATAAIVVIRGCRASEPEPPAKLVALAEAAAKTYKLDTITVKAVIEIESIWKPDARSAAGARGLMQIMPNTWAWVCKDVLK